jgi:hypothetical protein
MFGNVTPQIAVSLPMSLESRLGKVEVDAVSKLPPNIRRFKLEGLKRDHAFSSDFSFPVNLQKLILPYITPTLAALLPRKLKSLTLKNGKIHPNPEILELLPPSLTTLITLCVGSNITNDTYWKLFPKMLDRLDIITTKKEDFVEASVSDDSSLWLPRQLTSFIVGCVDIPSSKWFSGLPPNLEELKIMTHALPEDGILNMSCADTLTIFTLKLKDHPKRGYAQLFKDMPRRLTILHIDVLTKSPSQISIDDLLLLPPIIKFFNHSCVI